MRYLAEFDVMTGLANRSRFQARLSQAMERRGGALLLIDLDGFKQVNDNFGHAFGDDCLKDSADRLASACPQAELVARIGGDEFAVLVEADLDESAIEALAGRIVAALDRPVGPPSRSLRLGASVGIAHAGCASSTELFTRADAALYAAKSAGRNTFRTFDPGLMPQEPAKPGERRRRRR